MDFGFVGRIDRVRTALIEHLWAGGFTPVMSTLGVDAPGERTSQVYNINADTVSSAAAQYLRADHLFLMTNVPGVMRDKDDPATRIPRLTAAEARAAIAEGVIVGGMIPKVEEALGRLANGVGAVHILSPEAGALSAEVEAPGSAGTVLLA